MDAHDIFEQLRSPLASQSDTQRLLQELERCAEEPGFWRSCYARLTGSLLLAQQPQSFETLQTCVYYLNGLERVIASPSRWHVISKDDRLKVRTVLINISRIELILLNPLRLKACGALAKLGWRECTTTWNGYAEFVASEAAEFGRWEALASACEVFAAEDENEGDLITSSVRFAEVADYRKHRMSPVFVPLVAAALSGSITYVLRALPAFISWVALDCINLAFVQALLKETTVTPQVIVGLGAFFERSDLETHSPPGLVEVLNQGVIRIMSNHVLYQNTSEAALMCVEAFIKRVNSTYDRGDLRKVVSEALLNYSYRLLGHEECEASTFVTLTHIWQDLIDGLSQVMSASERVLYQELLSKAVFLFTDALLSFEDSPSRGRLQQWSVGDELDDANLGSEVGGVIASFAKLLAAFRHNLGDSDCTKLAAHVVQYMRALRRPQQSLDNLAVVFETLETTAPILAATFRAEAVALADNELASALQWLLDMKPCKGRSTCLQSLMKCLQTFNRLCSVGREEDPVQTASLVMLSLGKEHPTILFKAIDILATAHSKEVWMMRIASKSIAEFSRDIASVDVLEQLYRAFIMDAPPHLVAQALDGDVQVLSMSQLNPAAIERTFLGVSAMLEVIHDTANHGTKRELHALCSRTIVPAAATVIRERDSPPGPRSAAAVFILGWVVAGWEGIERETRLEALGMVGETVSTCGDAKTLARVLKLLHRAIAGRLGEEDDLVAWTLTLVETVERTDSVDSTAFVTVCASLFTKCESGNSLAKKEHLARILLARMNADETPEVLGVCLAAFHATSSDESLSSVLRHEFVVEIVLRVWRLIGSRRRDMLMEDMCKVVFAFSRSRERDVLSALELVSKVNFEKVLKTCAHSNDVRKVLLELR